MHESLNAYVQFCLIVNCELTHGGRLVDRLPYSTNGLTACRTGLLCFGELLEDILDATSFSVFDVLVSMALIRGRSWMFTFIMIARDF